MLEQGASRALQALLELTASDSEQHRALRALTLHMLEGYTPRLFEQWKLGPSLAEAVRGLERVPIAFPLELSEDDALARVDAVYILRERNLSVVLPEPAAFMRYLQHLDEQGAGIYAWLMGELMKACGLTVPFVFPERPFRTVSRMLDIYWVTHLYLLDTHYLRAPLRSADAPQWTEDLLASASWLVEERRFDLAAEVAVCLHAAGKAGSDAHRMLLDALVHAQQPDGRVLDTTIGEVPGDQVAHTTAVALLAFASAASS
jgi:D-amino peptidase